MQDLSEKTELNSRPSVLNIFKVSWADLKAPRLELGQWKALHNPGCLGMEMVTVFGSMICPSRINSVFKGLAVFFPDKHQVSKKRIREREGVLWENKKK